MATGPLPSGWAILVADNGRDYFYNAEMGVTQWDRPAPGFTAGAMAVLPPGWTEMTTSDGRLYFHNAEIGVTQWDRPTATSASAGRAAGSVTDAAASSVTDAAAGSVTDAPAGSITDAPAAGSVTDAAAGSVTDVPGSSWTPGGPAELVRYDYGVDLEELSQSDAELMSHFEDIDVDHTGAVTAEMIERFVQIHDLDMSTEAIDAAVEAQDLDGDGRITLREFLACQGKQVPLQQVWFIDHLYNRYSSSPKGITAEEIGKALATVEIQYTVDMLRHWMTHPQADQAEGAHCLPQEAFRQIFCPKRFVASSM